jgi:Type I phosphodiesterase / nucleotide pyrophosphatase
MRPTMRHWRRLLHGLAAGAIAGAVLCPLQLLMWPDVRLSAGAAMLAAAAWASWGAVWLGGLSFLVLEAVSLLAVPVAFRPGIALTAWRWLVAVYALLAAAVAFYNREITPARLIGPRRSALGTAGSLLFVAFLLALVSAVRRRPTRRPLRHAATLAAPALIAVWTVLAVTPPPPPVGPPPPTPTFSAQHHLLFVSWEGADLPWLVPSIERGDMPFLRSLWERGAWGQTRTVVPFSRTAALATLATGCSPAVHGVLERRAYRLPWLSPSPISLLLEGPWPNPSQLPWRAWELAATPTPRRAPLWEILQRSGLRVGLGGWPGLVHATWVASPPLAAEAIPFPSLEADLRGALQPALASHPEAAPSTRAAFSIAVETASSTALKFAAQPVDALLVDSDLVARLRPLWAAPEGESAPGDVLAAAARLLDEELRDLVSLLGADDTLIVVLSPYGMSPPSAWRRLLQALRGTDRWRVSPHDSPDGFVMFAGPGVRPQARLRGSRLADVTATILYLLELPVARDMSGRVLLDVVTEERTATVPLRLIPSYPPTTRMGR